LKLNAEETTLEQTVEFFKARAQDVSVQQAGDPELKIG
jgi:hypothetical protein